MDFAKELPPMTLSSATAPKLANILPVLLSMTSRGDNPSFDDEDDKPAWWPKEIQWTNPNAYGYGQSKDGLEILKKLVHCCYSYHGVEDLLGTIESSDYPELSSDNIDDIIEVNDDAEDSQGASGDSPQESDNPVYVCCFCLDQFGSHDEVNSHQNVCKKKSQPSPVKESIKNAGTDESSLASSFIESVVKSSREWEGKSTSEDHRLALYSEQEAIPTSYVKKTSEFSEAASSFVASSRNEAEVTCSTKLSSSSARDKRPAFVPTLKTRSQRRLDQIMEKHNSRLLMIKECKEMKSVPRSGAWWSHRKRHKSGVSSHPSETCSKHNFTSLLGLVEKRTLKTRAALKKEKEVDLDCEITLVEGPMSNTPQSSSSPRQALCSPRSRSLMSQLSRDTDIDTRRRISFSFVEDEWADKEALEEGRDPLSFSLLTLGFSSPLGQRIKKYMKGEGCLNIIKDPEQYCRTEEEDNSYSKLRFRASDYRITFKRKCKSSSFVHKYKFNKQQVLEFKYNLKNSLSVRTRHMLKSMKPCKILANKMTHEDIKNWKSRTITIPDKIVYDEDVCITQIELPESLVAKEKAKAREHFKSHPQLHQQMTGIYPQVRTNRPIMTSQSHMPNIFRNNHGHSPSPRLGSPRHQNRHLLASNTHRNLSPSMFSQPRKHFPPYPINSAHKENPMVSKWPPNQIPTALMQSSLWKNMSAHSSHSNSNNHTPQNQTNILRNTMLAAVQRNSASASSRRKQQLTNIRTDNMGPSAGSKSVNGDSTHHTPHRVSHANLKSGLQPSPHLWPSSQNGRMSSGDLSASHKHYSPVSHLANTERHQPSTAPQPPLQQRHPSQGHNCSNLARHGQERLGTPHNHAKLSCPQHPHGHVPGQCRTPGAPKPIMKQMPQDDDVLEVICIDDD